MRYKNLEDVLDELFGPFSKERDLILQAITKDIEAINKVNLYKGYPATENGWEALEMNLIS